jgi:hypothetical protein
MQCKQKGGRRRLTLIEAETADPDVRPLWISAMCGGPPLESRPYREDFIPPGVAEQRHRPPDVVTLCERVDVRAAVLAIAWADCGGTRRFGHREYHVQDCGIFGNVRRRDTLVRPRRIPDCVHHFWRKNVGNVVDTRSEEVALLERDLPLCVRRLLLIHRAQFVHIHVVFGRDCPEIDKNVADCPKPGPPLGFRVPAWQHCSSVNSLGAVFRALQLVPSLDLLGHFGQRRKL